MRFVPTYCLREGMIVGKSIYNQNGSVIIARNTKIEKSYIDRIQKFGFVGIYIIDSCSHDIEIKNVIDENLRMKAVQSVKKTFVVSEGKKEIPKECVKESKLLIENIVDDILKNKNIMVNIIDLKSFDDYTYFHCTNVATLSIVMGATLGLSKSKLSELGFGALLHDIGKVFIKKEIINKEGKLTNEEYKIIQNHSRLGYNYLKRNKDISTNAKYGVLQHHEKYNGTGYPNKIVGNKISLYGRIISIADVYDALTSDRPYRKALLPSEAIEYIMANGGSMFDTELIKVFVTKIAPYPVGMSVKLSNGMVGIVYKNYEDAIIRPKIRIIKNKLNKNIEPFMVDLRNDKEYISATIVEIVG